MYFNQLVLDILTSKHKSTSNKRSHLVGVDGLSGAGKTTLVNKLESVLKKKRHIVLIHLDDHIVERNKRYSTEYDEWYEYYYLQWDIDMLTEELFKKVASNFRELILPFYEKSMDQIRYDRVLIPADCIVLVEGIFLQRKEWKPYIDYTIFIDCPDEIRYKRILNRDTYIGGELEILHKYKRRYWPGEKHYLTTVNPMQKADIIFHGHI